MSRKVHVLISGRVQGVGFRYSTHREALNRGLTGWVRNLPDGRVEAEFEGELPELEDMLAWCRQGPRGARVDDVACVWDASESRHAHFTVRS